MRRRWKAYMYVLFMAGTLAVGGMYLLDKTTTEVTPSKTQVYNLDEFFEIDLSKNSDIQTVDDKHVLMEPKTLADEKEATFVLRNVDDFVVVYRNGNLHERYMTTGIKMKELPVETQNEIIIGKEIADEEALYFFLESHSS